MTEFRKFLRGAALARGLRRLPAIVQLPAQAADQVVRIGYQKYGNFILLKGTGALDKTLAARGFKVEWTEFPSGPPLLEALNAGAIDIGQTGEAPPIFAQAANAGFVYVAHEPPAPKGEAILVPKDSPIKSVADLKGKKVALNKGSNVHYLLVKLLEQSGVKYSEIEPVFLAPADARAAFETRRRRCLGDLGSLPGRRRSRDQGAHARRRHRRWSRTINSIWRARASPRPIRRPSTPCLPQSPTSTDWADGNAAPVAQQLSAGIGIPAPVLEIALKRQTYGIKPLDDATVAEQQKIADTFYALGLLPKPITVAAIVRRTGS